jgi:hypothetical protein
MTEEKWWKKEENLKKNGLLKLSIAQLKQIQDRGYSWAIVSNRKIKITKDDLVFIEDEINEVLKGKEKI